MNNLGISKVRLLMPIAGDACRGSNYFNMH